MSNEFDIKNIFRKQEQNIKAPPGLQELFRNRVKLLKEITKIGFENNKNKDEKTHNESIKKQPEAKRLLKKRIISSLSPEGISPRKDFKIDQAILKELQKMKKPKNILPKNKLLNESSPRISLSPFMTSCDWKSKKSVPLVTIIPTKDSMDSSLHLFQRATSNPDLSLPPASPHYLLPHSKTINPNHTNNTTNPFQLTGRSLCPLSVSVSRTLPSVRQPPSSPGRSALFSPSSGLSVRGCPSPSPWT